MKPVRSGSADVNGISVYHSWMFTLVDAQSEFHRSRKF